MESSKRIKVTPKNPNPLFKMWIKEWIEEAEKKRKKSSNFYQKALDSLDRYPLTLFSGYDCSILESFGPKICKMLDEKLEKHLIERLDLYQWRNHKDKIAELQRREGKKLAELIANIEAACLSENSLLRTTLLDNDQDIEMRVVSEVRKESEKDEHEEQDIDIPEELLSSEAESEDSFDRLLKKYDPVRAKNSKKSESQRKLKTKTQSEVIMPAQRKEDVIDLSLSPPPSNHTPISESPISVRAENRRSLKRHQTFGARSNFAGPSHASSPISNFLDVETSFGNSPVASSSKRTARNENDDEFDRLAAKYDFLSPIAASKPTTKFVKKPSNSKLKAPVQISIQKALKQPESSATSAKRPATALEDENEAIKYVSIDEINPLDFDVILLVDLGETSGKSKSSSDELIRKLNESNVKNDVRKLHVGDFTWIAKHKIQKSKEFVLPYIIERKRLDDLSSSIKDGRFHEQKFRLKQCGVDNVIYLIENHGRLPSGLPFTTLLQAATNTQIHSKFQVKFTESSQHTILYLTVMTSFIENIFRNKSPLKFQLMEFQSFNRAAVKQRKLTVRETFIKQLLALKGLSVDMALEITKVYPTPCELYHAYQDVSRTEGESLLTKITIGNLKRKIPAPASKSIYELYTRDKL